MFAVVVVAAIVAIVLVMRAHASSGNRHAGYPAYDDGLARRAASHAAEATAGDTPEPMDAKLLGAIMRGNEQAHRGMAEAAASGHAITSPVDRADAARAGRLYDEGVTIPPAPPAYRPERPAFDTDDYRVSTSDGD